MIKVLVFGTFDGLHKGHIDFFKQARQFGDYLVVVVARDSSVKRQKNKVPKYNEQERMEKVKESRLVNKTMLGKENHDPRNDPYIIIKEINPNVICLGYDQSQFIDKLKTELKKMGLENVRVEILKPYRPEKYKSSILNNI